MEAYVWEVPPASSPIIYLVSARWVGRTRGGRRVPSEVRQFALRWSSFSNNATRRFFRVFIVELEPLQTKWAKPHKTHTALCEQTVREKRGAKSVSGDRVLVVLRKTKIDYVNKLESRRVLYGINILHHAR